MSADALEWAWKQQGLPSLVKMVLLRLCHLADDRGWCCPSQAHIAADTSMSRKSVNRSIKQLIENGLIEAKTQNENGAKIVSAYSVRCNPQSYACNLQSLPPHVTHSPITESILEVKNTSSLRSEGAASAPPNPVKDLWLRGVAILGEGNRRLLGKMVKQYGPVAVLGAIVACEEETRADPAGFFVKACETRARDAPQNYHQTPLGNLFEGAKRAADAFNARQSLGNRRDREPVVVPLLDGSRTRSDPSSAA